MAYEPMKKEMVSYSSLILHGLSIQSSIPNSLLE